LTPHRHEPALPRSSARLRAARHVLTPLALFGGMALLFVVGADATLGLPFSLPRTLYVHRFLWVAAGLLLVAGGVALGREPPQPAGWTAARPGRRCRRIVVYGREGCHLCDDAKDILARYLEYLPHIEDRDISGDASLTGQFGQSIPVVEIDGKVRFRGRLDEGLFRRWIEATPPLTD